jgi:hypothetical protein
MVMVLAILYVMAAYVLVLVPGMLWRRYRPQWRKDVVHDRSWKLKFNQKAATFLTIATVVLCTVVYMNQRSEWMGENNAHYDAKEYFAAGQVLLGMRLGLTTFLNPDNPIVWPLNWLQQGVFAAGSRQLPKGDGEIGIWVDGWFVYPYSRRALEPYGTNKFQRSPRMISLLDKAWFSIETVATKPIADRDMRTKHYYRNFPGMLFYYCINEGYYAGRKVGSQEVIVRNPVHIARSKKIVEWATELEKKWSDDQSTLDFVRQNKKVQAVLQACLILEIGDVIHSDILSGRFHCDQTYVDLLVKTINNFGIGTKDQPPAYASMKNRNERESLFSAAIETIRSRFIMFILTEKCGKNFFLDSNQILYDRKRGDRRKLIEDLFRDELAIIRGVGNE